MEAVEESSAMLAIFAARHASLLEAMAAVWTRAGGGRLLWRDPAGGLLYGSGAPSGSAISAWLPEGTLSVEGGSAALGPLLESQAELLHHAIEHEAEMDSLTDELMRTTDQLVALYEVSAVARAGRELGDVIHTCLEQAARLTDAECALLVLRESPRDGQPLRRFAFPAQATIDADFLARLLPALAVRDTVIIANSPEECAALLTQPPASLSRLICAPIAIAGQIDAVLCALNKPSDFTSGDLKLVSALADAAAGILEREHSHRRDLAQAQLRRELEIAAEMQSRLLPRDLPSLSGAQLAAASRASRQVGGDFFEALALPGARLGLALGDVTGTGVTAALLMAMAHGLLKAGLLSTRSPAEAVRQLNAGLFGDLSNAEMLLTLFAATYDSATHELRAINCGHSPVLLCRRGAVELWEADGQPLGVLPDLLSVERARALESGDVLVVLSDGFSEARDAHGNRIGIDALIDVVRRTTVRDAASIGDALRARVEAFGRGGPPEDDQTWIVLKIE